MERLQGSTVPSNEEVPDSDAVAEGSSPAASPAPAPPTDDETLARILAARGVPQEEIDRLLQLGKKGAQRPPDRTMPLPAALPSCPIPGPHFEPKPAIQFPDFRESTREETERADGILRQAALHRRRGRLKEALAECEQAIALVPSDAAALELYGDVLQGLGRVDDALAAYRRAGEADPRRASAERKYAELLLLQDRGVKAFVAAEPRNPYVAVLLSALCPGAGQFYNGQPAKALVLALTALALAVALLWTPLGFGGTTGISGSAAFLMACFGVVYVFSLVDANIGARSATQTKSGWDV